MAGKEYYSLLGVSRNASEREIKQAYRRLARRYHPDINREDKAAEARFKEINEAYEILSDKEKRRKYDQYGDQWQHADQFAQTRGQTPFRDFGPGGTTSSQFSEGDLGNLFDELFWGFDSGASRHRPRQGQDIKHPVEVTLEEAYHGTTHTLSLELEEPCSTCRGTGRIQRVPCAVCRGSGRVSKVKRLEVKIPAGVKDGSPVRIAAQGGLGYGGAKNGDLYLMISVKPHPLFERRGDDLLVEVSVPLTVAVLGGEAEVPIPGGKLALKIPPETQNGRIFRLAGQGMPNLGNSSRGDLLVKVKVILPTNLSSQEKALFKQLSQFRPSGGRG